MITKLLLSAALALGLLSCEAQKKSQVKPKPSSAKTSTNVTKKDGKIYTLAEGETMFIDEAQMNVTFNYILEDSRCPEGTNCIWAGVAVADLTLMGTYTRPYHAQISTGSFPSKNYFDSINFNGYTLKLKSLTPGKNEKSKSDKHTITFNIQKGETQSQPANSATTR